MESSLSIPVAILAAGEGSRLQGSAERVPKPCMPLEGATIAEWSLKAFRLAGIREIRVGVGFMSTDVRRHYQVLANNLQCDIEFVDTDGWEQGNGVTALALARSFEDRPFLLAMADHMFSPQVVHLLLDRPPDMNKIALAVDPFPDTVLDLADLTKVLVKSDHVVAIGKDLRSWNAGDTGLFHCGRVLAESLSEAQEKNQFSLSDGVRRCAERGLVQARQLGEKNLWIDIDTPSDLGAAAKVVQQLLSEHALRSAIEPR